MSLYRLHKNFFPLFTQECNPGVIGYKHLNFTTIHDSDTTLHLYLQFTKSFHHPTFSATLGIYLFLTVAILKCVQSVISFCINLHFCDDEFEHLHIDLLAISALPLYIAYSMDLKIKMLH